MRTDTPNDPVRAALRAPNPWRVWFDAWEPKAAEAWDAALRQSWLVEPVAATLTAIARTKAIGDSVRRRLVRACGLATRDDQDRILFLLQRMESRLLDLEERLADEAER